MYRKSSALKLVYEVITDNRNVKRYANTAIFNRNTGETLATLADAQQLIVDLYNEALEEESGGTVNARLIDDMGTELHEGDIIKVTYTDVNYMPDGKLNYVDLTTPKGEEYSEIGIIRSDGHKLDAYGANNEAMHIYYRWYNKLEKIGNIIDDEIIKTLYKEEQV